MDRALSCDELDRRGPLEASLDRASEDDLIENVLLPLFQTRRFHRILIADHEIKAPDYSKDVWIKNRLPTGHRGYWGLEAKRGKIDVTARTKNDNLAEVNRHITMMLRHEIFSPETSKKHLVDHAMIVQRGTVLQQARYWLSE